MISKIVHPLRSAKLGSVPAHLFLWLWSYFTYFYTFPPFLTESVKTTFKLGPKLMFLYLTMRYDTVCVLQEPNPNLVVKTAQDIQQKTQISEIQKCIPLLIRVPGLRDSFLSRVPLKGHLGGRVKRIIGNRRKTADPV